MTTATLFARAGEKADQVRTEARELDPVKVLLTLLFALPFALGWLAGMAVRALWTVFAWTWTAAVVGFRTARPRGDERT
jgi:hypothetical protein